MRKSKAETPRVQGRSNLVVVISTPAVIFLIVAAVIICMVVSGVRSSRENEKAIQNMQRDLQWAIEDGDRVLRGLAPLHQPAPSQR